MATDTDNLDDDNEYETVEVLDLINHQQFDLYIYGSLLAAFLSFYLDFFRASAPFVGAISIDGTRTDAYVQVLVLVIVAAGAVAISRYIITVIVSILIAGIGVWYFFTLQSRIARFNAELQGNMFGEAASASVGLGIYILIAAGIVATVLAAKRVDIPAIEE
jgi:fatty acid desaturase